MPRRRFRPTDPLVRDRNQLEILGAPGLAGLSRVGGRPGGTGGSNIVIRGGGEGPGTQIEHVTLSATASQTIAAGGSGVEWNQIGDAPTEIRGFDTLQTELVDSGAVVAIPVNLTGVLNYILEGMWESWRGSGNLTVTKTASDGSEESRTYDLGRNGIATRAFGGDDDGWEVDAGDTMTYQLPNGSGSGQVLSWATLVQKVIGLNSPTSQVTVPPSVFIEDTFAAATLDTMWTLRNGATLDKAGGRIKFTSEGAASDDGFISYNVNDLPENPSYWRAEFVLERTGSGLQGSNFHMTVYGTDGTSAAGLGGVYLGIDHQAGQATLYWESSAVSPATAVSFADGVHTVVIEYDGSQVTVTFDDAELITWASGALTFPPSAAQRSLGVGGDNSSFSSNQYLTYVKFEVTT